jgi:phospholipid/cholesterol/gamma-HCH transport system ATP-binding protein
MHMSALLEIEDLHFSYGDQVILKGVSLSVEQGQVVGILGTSGSGKSTLLRLIGGQLKPSKGCVRFLGKVVHEQSIEGLYKLRRDMGMMFQAGGLFSDLTVLNNVAFALREHTNLNPDLIELTSLMKLESVGLRGAANLMPSELSGGMSRRVALARAIAMDPKLSIYDEPFAGLDPISLNAVANLIRRLNDALGSTSIVVTYDVTESLKVADQIFLLADGRVVVQGSPKEMEDSDNPYADQFIHAKAEGPVPFHVLAPPLKEELELH